MQRKAENTTDRIDTAGNNIAKQYQSAEEMKNGSELNCKIIVL